MNSGKIIFSLVLLPTLLTGCGWVDSTGDQGSRNNGSPSDTVILVDGGATLLNEESTTTLSLQNAPGTTSGWTWRAENSSVALSLCQTQEGFDGAVAVQQLSQACTSADNCALSVEDFSTTSRTAFDVTLPELRAPVALSYSIETTMSDGEPYSQKQIICGVAINEAPTVNDSEYLALTNTTRVVFSSDPRAVLAGASDDVHIRNESLSVKQVIDAPQYADALDVSSDGTFRYTPRQNLGIANNVHLDDDFTLLITDGMHEVEATVRLRLVNFNISPYVVSNIPNYQVDVEDETAIALNVDLSTFFGDVDGDSLLFRARDNSLLQSGRLTLSDDGRLQGELTIDDAGSYEFQVFATDRLYETSDTFTLIVQDTRPQNQAPQVNDIPNVRVDGAFSIELSTYFSDPDGDTLTYTALTLPPGVQLSNSGTLTGVATAQNEGRWLLQITASDNRGGTATDRFRLTVNY